MPTADPALLRRMYDNAVSYADFVALAEANGQRGPWDQRYGQLELTGDQQKLVADFPRDVHVLTLTGTWCGDCALQGAAIQRIAEANPDRIRLKFLLRDEPAAELIVKSQINAGFRVPVTWWLAEDFAPVFSFGDRTLSRYRSMARKALPPDESAALGLKEPGPDHDPVRAVLDEMLTMFERAQLLLRLSGRLREKHGD
ncbi:MAG: thioredoxin family protein [Planctomycetota bacterium]